MFKIFKYWKESLLGSLFCVLSICGFAQEKKWHNILQENALEGRVSAIKAEDGYARLPLSLKNEVREPVWNLGQDAAGVYVDFKTNASSIVVKYKVNGGLNMPHMPSTGVSGLDLYAKSSNSNQWNWITGNYSFKDTISYTFQNYVTEPNSTYRLYLPLYNSVEWMELGIGENDQIEFLHQKTRPIIVYGTSIAQGACASRPGLGWTNWMGRNFDEEAVNLAFSGNGRLEQPILDLIKKEDASVFILDCVPNLGITAERTEEMLIGLIVNAVKTIRSEHPNTPIVIAAHSSSQVPGVLNKKNTDGYNLSSAIAEKTVKELQNNGDKNLYWLTSKEIGLDNSSTVDYAHPNDLGMEKIAAAYTKLLQKIIK